jgi:uncharacterized membrane protein
MSRTADTADVPQIEVERFAREVVLESWEAFKTDPLLYILASLVVAVLGVVSLSVLLGPLTVGFILIVQRRRRGQPAQVSDLFDGLSQFVSAFIAFVLIVIAAFIGCLLLVVPGLLVLYVSCFAFHELTYRKTGAVEALQGSFRIIKRSALHALLLLVGVAALNALGSAVVFGTLLTAPFGLLMMSVAYEKLTGQTPGSAVALDTP